jgi:uncharacterized membrane protein YhaH (DUF805 family)
MTEVQNYEAAIPAPNYKFRMPRLPYLVFSILIFFTLPALMMLFIPDNASPIEQRDTASFLVLFALGFMMIISVGRYHDTGASGAWSLLLFLPFVSLVVWIYLLLTPSAKASLKAMKPRPT